MRILICALLFIFTVFLHEAESSLRERYNRDGSLFYHKRQLARMNPDGSIHIFTKAELREMDQKPPIPVVPRLEQGRIRWEPKFPTRDSDAESSSQGPLSPVKFENNDLLYQGSETPAIYRGRGFYRSDSLLSTRVYPQDGAVVTRNGNNYAIHENGAFRRWTPADASSPRRSQ